MALKQKRSSATAKPATSRPKRLFLGEWMESLDPPITAAELARQTGLEKSQISRWVNHETVPHDAQLRILGDFFKVEPEALQIHPDAYWSQQFFSGRDKKERDGIKELMTRSFPRKA